MPLLCLLLSRPATGPGLSLPSLLRRIRHLNVDFAYTIGGRSTFGTRQLTFQFVILGFLHT